MKVPSNVAAIIVGHRNAAGMSRARLSELSGVPIRTIEDWEAGRRLPRDVWQIWSIASTLGISIEKYLGLDGEAQSE